MGEQARPRCQPMGQTQPQDGQTRHPHGAVLGRPLPTDTRGKWPPLAALALPWPQAPMLIPRTGGCPPGLYISSLFIRVGFTTASCQFKLLLHEQLRAVQRVDLNVPALHALQHARLCKDKLLPRLIYLVPFK